VSTDTTTPSGGVDATDIIQNLKKQYEGATELAKTYEKKIKQLKQQVEELRSEKANQNTDMENKRKKPKQNERNMKPSSSNRFEILDETMEEDDEIQSSNEILELMKLHNKAEKNKQHKTKQPTIPTTTTTAKHQHVPPIKVFNTDSKLVSKLLSNELGKDKYTIKNLSQQKISIKLKEKEDIEKTKKLFEKSGTQYFTFTNKNDKLQTYLLKGLSVNYTPAEILEYINELKIDDLEIIKAFRFSTVKSKTEGKELPIIVIQLSANSKAQSLKEIKYIDGTCVNFEKLRRSGILQCFRCQRYGHVSSNCNMQFRCVKCNENHNPGECKMPDITNKDKLYCVLCKKTGHPASWKGCEIYQKLIKTIKERKIQKEQLDLQKIQQINNYVKTGISYANVASNQSHPNNTDSPNNLQLQINKLSNIVENLAAKVDALMSALSVT